MNTNLNQSLLPHMDLIKLYTHISIFQFDNFLFFFRIFLCLLSSVGAQDGPRTSVTTDLIITYRSRMIRTQLRASENYSSCLVSVQVARMHNHGFRCSHQLGNIQRTLIGLRGEGNEITSVSVRALKAYGDQRHSSIYS